MKTRNKRHGKRNEALGDKVWEAVNSLLPEGAIFAVAFHVPKMRENGSTVISNIPEDKDVEDFLRLMADEHAKV